LILARLRHCRLFVALFELLIRLIINSLHWQLPVVEKGSLYPALHRMEALGWIVSEWGLSENNRRARYYRLTATGRKQLEREIQNWETTASAIFRVVQMAS
jgi:DNA-binding PadR family transcriptional regulator